MKRVLHFILRLFSKAILKKYKPDVIGITGSVGKTSCKEAVYAVLADIYNVRKNIDNYNNEVGVPLTIIGVESGQKSILRWLGIFIKAIGLLLKKDVNYPDILILEMAADKPGDIKYLLSFIRCKIGILTAVGEAHIGFFGSVNKIAVEKRLIISELAKFSWAVINKDNELAWQQQAHSKAQVMGYGIEQETTVQAQDITLTRYEKTFGLNFKLKYQNTTVPVFLPNIISRQHIYAALAGVAVAIIYDINLVTISDKIQNYQGIPGRTQLISGIKHTQIIDDSYNSSPLAARAALDLLIALPVAAGAKRYAVLGDMLELGQHSEVKHQKVGESVVEHKLDYLITVGERSRDIARGAKQAGMSEDHIFMFTNLDEAGHFLQNRIKQGDIILIKGSQGVRMEFIVKEIMAHPELAEELLTRQTPDWLAKKP